MGDHALASVDRSRQPPSTHRFHHLGKRRPWSGDACRDPSPEGLPADGDRRCTAICHRSSAGMATAEGKRTEGNDLLSAIEPFALWRLFEALAFVAALSLTRATTTGLP